MQRRDGGARLRKAMADEGYSIPRLAEQTKAVDPAGYGVSSSLIGALVSQGSSARERCRRRSAELIAAALPRPVDDLFRDAPTPHDRNIRNRRMKDPMNAETRQEKP